MKKLFLFTVALLTSLMVGATTYTLEPGEKQIENKLSELVDGDVLELKTGTYTEWSSLVFTTKVTLKAADGASPKLALYNWQIQNDFEINGVEITNVSTDNYLFRVNAAVAGTVAFKNCSMQCNAGTITTTTPYILLEKGVGTLTIDSCTFAPNAKNEGAIVYGLTTVNNFTMTNSTAVACGGTDLAVYMTKLTNAVVDHCTFYNCGARVLYLKGDAMASCAVSNCIVANAALVEQCCVATYAGTVDNCVYHNTASAPRSESPVVVNGCINADPLFVDPANGNFNFAFTSPLFLAATDGTHIGDPRWGVAEPETAIAVPDTLPATQAVLCGTKISASENGIAWNNNSENPNDNSASWVIDVAKAGNYEVVIYEASTSGHSFMACVANNETWLDTITEKSSTEWTHNEDITIGAFTFDAPGKYLVRLMNGKKNSYGIAKYCIMNYAGGAVVDIPDTLPNEDALLYGPKIKKTEDGIAWNNNGDAAADYAVWNVNVDKAGDYIVKMTVSKINSSGHTFSLDIYDGTNQKVGNTINEPSGEVTLAAGNYTVRLNNATQWSSAVMESVSIFYKGGAVMPIPGILPGEEAVLTGQMIRLANGSFQWPNKSDQENHYATWNVTAAAAGEVDVTLHVGTPSSGHCFTVGLYEGETLKASISEDATAYSTGTLLLGSITIPAAGSYTIRLNNAVSWSSAIVDSIKLSTTVAPTVITIEDDTEVDFTAYEGQIVTIKLIRTFKANMYNPICLPFALNSSALSNILKADKSYVLDSASLEEQKLYVELKQGSGIYQGTPNMIKPSEDVENPVFTNVEIKTTSPDQTTRGVLRLQGSFASHAIDKNALLVGANNTLFFPNDEKTPYIKSMRAYFILVGQAVGAPIKSACFREPGNAPTWMPIIGVETEKPNGKFIRNGRFVIVREGKEYGILGVEK